MATYNFLDKTGLGQVWAKIKALIPSKTSDLQNDSGFITDQSDWTEDDSTDDAYILNRPAIRAGEGENSIVEGDINHSYDVVTLYLTGDANSANYTFTTNDTLPSTVETSIKSNGLIKRNSTFRYITAFNATNHTISLNSTLNSSATLSNEAVSLYYAHKEAFGADSHVEGSRVSVATGANSHAEGRSLAIGGTSHSEGNNTKAIGLASHAENNGTIAKSSYSHAEGSGTIAASASQHTQGKYNIEDTNGVYADIVGNGTADNARSNAYTLDWSGNGVYAGKLTVGAGPTNNMDVATKQYVDNAIPTVPDDLGDLTDTAISSPANGQILKYNSTTSKWVNADESSDVFVVTVSGSPKTSNKTFSEISAAITAGKEVICIDSGTNYVYQLQSYGNWEIRFILTELYYDGEAGSYEAYTDYVTIDSSNSVTAGYISHTIPHITINGSATANPSFYAPTSAGTSGYVLKSNGSGAPTWAAETEEIFIVNLTYDEQTDESEVDKTYTEIVTAANQGKKVFLYNTTYGTCVPVGEISSECVFFKSVSVIYASNVVEWQLFINSDNTINENYIYSAYASISTPLADGIGSAGSSTDYARADHVHPKITQTLSMSNNVITLTGSDGTTSSVTLPVYNGGVVTPT